MRKILAALALISSLLALPARADFTAKDASLATITFKNPGVCTSVVCVPVFQIYDGANVVTLTTAGADAVSNTLTGVPMYARNLVFNGTTWDRWTGAVTNAGTFAVQLTGATNNINNIAGTISLPTGAATAAGLTTINTTLGSPFQAGASIGNTTFAATQATAANLKAQVDPLTAANWGIGATAAAVPANAHYWGVNISGNQVGVTGLALGATTKAPTVAIVDGSGNQITAFGGSGGTASNFGSTFPTAGTAIGLTNGTNMVAWSATTTYGTAPAAIAVPAVNAFVTNASPGIANNADAIAAVAAGATSPVAVNNYGYVFNGTTWDRMRSGTQTGSVAVASADPCLGANKTNLPISQNGTASVQLVALSGATSIYVCSLSLIAAGATTVALTTGTGSACVTGNAAVIGTTTASIANSMSLAANGGLTLGNGAGTIAKGAASSELCMVLGTSVFVSGNLTFVQQ